MGLDRGVDVTKRVLVSAACVLLSCLSAAPADLPTDHFQLPPAPAYPQAPVFYDYELRIGGLAHDPTSPEKGSADLNAEILFPKFWHASGFWDQLIPHADVGVTANFVGKTSNLYAGAAWNFDVFDRFFVSGEFGPGVNNGKTGAAVPDGHSKVGCNFWFHESGSIGYHLTDHINVMGTIEHSSNAGLCTENRGVTNYGVRLGYRF